MERDLESYRVGSLPRIYYVPEFISEAQEAQLLCEIRASKFKWTQVSGRRLQNHGGVVHTSGWLIQQQLPSWLQPLAQLTHSSTGVFGSDPPNHVLINSYEPGEGILPHEDGPLYHPGVCILSLGAPAVLHFTKKRDGDGNGSAGQQGESATGVEEARGARDASPRYSVACMPRSLLVFAGEAYTDFLHGIWEVDEEAIDEFVVNSTATGLKCGSNLPRGGERISITVRRVLKVKRNLIRL